MTTTQIVQLVLDILLFGVLVFSAIDDVKTRIVKPVFQWITLGLAIIEVVFAFGHYGWLASVIHIATGVGMFVIHIAMVLIFKAGIGGADTKMTSMLSLYLGVWPAVIMVVTHSITGILYAAFGTMLTKKRIKSVPLMAFLLIGFTLGALSRWIFGISF